MAQLSEDLLQEVQAFLGGTLAEESSALSAVCDQQRKTLLRKIVSTGVGAASGLQLSSTLYLDMNGVKSNYRSTSPLDTTRRSSTGDDDVDTPQCIQNNDSHENISKADTCTACSVCTVCENLFPFEDSQREPSALEAKLATDLLRCGVISRLWTVPLPLLWRQRRRCWAALFPGRLLLFASERSSRPRAVLPLRAACNAAYSARLSTNSLLPNAIELCCPGRKTHQLLASDIEDARAWLDAIRLAGCHSSKSSKPTASPSDSNTCSEDKAPFLFLPQPLTPTPTSPPATNGTVTAVSHSGGDTPKADTEQPSAVDLQQYEPMSSDSCLPPLSAPDDIYHDIAPPATPSPSPSNQPEYENGDVDFNKSNPVNNCEEEQERPVYDDVGQLHLYKNVPLPGSKQDTSPTQEIVYDDVGIMNGNPTQGSNAGALYELIDDNNSTLNNNRL